MNGTTQGFSQGDVNNFDRFCTTNFTEVLTDTVRDHDIIVERETDDCKECCKYSQVKWPLHHRKNPEGDDNVME